MTNTTILQPLLGSCVPEEDMKSLVGATVGDGQLKPVWNSVDAHKGTTLWEDTIFRIVVVLLGHNVFLAMLKNMFMR